MGLDLSGVHKYIRVEGTTEAKLVSVHPAITISVKGYPKVYLQDGGIYYASGDVVDTLPKKVRDAIKNLSKEAKESVGFTDIKKPVSLHAIAKKALEITAEASSAIEK